MHHGSADSLYSVYWQTRPQRKRSGNTTTILRLQKRMPRPLALEGVTTPLIVLKGFTVFVGQKKCRPYCLVLFSFGFVMIVVDVKRLPSPEVQSSHGYPLLL